MSDEYWLGWQERDRPLQLHFRNLQIPLNRLRAEVFEYFLNH